MCLFLWQGSIYPVLGLGNETINNVNNNGLNTKIVVQRGETLWHLAQRHQTTVEELVKLNQVKRPDRISEGQPLWVPTKEIALSTQVKATEEVRGEGDKIKVAHKLTEMSWWLTILRKIPAFATVTSPTFLVKAETPTYEIVVSQDTKLPERVLANSVLATTEDVPKVEVPKVEAPKTLPAITSESQLHSRGLGRLVSEEEIELLSRVIYGEARGEDFLGQVAVGAVVLNRLKDSRFPKTIRGIVYQSGAFTAVDDQQIHLDPDDQAYKAAKAALSGLDPTNGAIFYYNPRTATDKWIKSRTVIKRIGNHTFSI